MNLILINPQEIDDNTVIFKDQRSTHIRKILRAKKGDSVKIGIINGSIGTGQILDIATDSVTLSIHANDPPPPKAEIDLILALPRPIMLKRVLAQATSIGVNKIFLIKANRIEKSFFHASLLKNKAYQEHLLLGLEQAMDTKLPEVSIHKQFKPFVEDILPTIIKNTPVRLVAHPETEHTLIEATPCPLKSRAIIAIGPEGGWVDFEIKKFRECEFTPFSMGSRILRVDTVVPALLSQLTLLQNFKE